MRTYQRNKSAPSPQNSGVSNDGAAETAGPKVGTPRQTPISPRDTENSLRSPRQHLSPPSPPKSSLCKRSRGASATSQASPSNTNPANLKSPSKKSGRAFHSAAEFRTNSEISPSSFCLSQSSVATSASSGRVVHAPPTHPTHPSLIGESELQKKLEASVGPSKKQVKGLQAQSTFNERQDGNSVRSNSHCESFHGPPDVQVHHMMKAAARSVQLCVPPRSGHSKSADFAAAKSSKSLSKKTDEQQVLFDDKERVEKFSGRKKTENYPSTASKSNSSKKQTKKITTRNTNRSKSMKASGQEKGQTTCDHLIVVKPDANDCIDELKNSLPVHATQPRQRRTSFMEARRVSIFRCGDEDSNEDVETLSTAGSLLLPGEEEGTSSPSICAEDWKKIKADFPDLQSAEYKENDDSPIFHGHNLAQRMNDVLNEEVKAYEAFCCGTSTSFESTNDFQDSTKTESGSYTTEIRENEERRSRSPAEMSLYMSEVYTDSDPKLSRHICHSYESADESLEETWMIPTRSVGNLSEIQMEQ